MTYHLLQVAAHWTIVVCLSHLWQQIVYIVDVRQQDPGLMLLHLKVWCEVVLICVQAVASCACVCRYGVKLLRNNSHWLMNSGTTKSLTVGNAAVMTVVIDSNSTNVSSACLLCLITSFVVARCSLFDIRSSDLPRDKVVWSGVCLLFVFQFELTVYTMVRPSEISVWYQFPQYIVITAGEVLFSVTGLSFAYTQVTCLDAHTLIHCVCPATPN